MVARRTIYSNNELILFGKVCGIHGLNGNVKVKVFVNKINEYSSKDIFILESPNKVRKKKVFFEWNKPYNGKIYIFFFKNIKSRESAKKIVGFSLWTLKKGALKFNKDTYFWVDLIGMAVKNRDGTFLGYLSSIIRTGANDVYVIRKNIDPRFSECENEILIPAIKSVVMEVSIKKSLMLVNLPDCINS